MNLQIGRRRLPVRRLAAWCGLCAGVGALLILLLNSGHQGIPGWQPANESLRLTLAISGEGASLPTQSFSGINGTESGDVNTTHNLPTTVSSAAAPALTQSDAVSTPAAASASEPSDALGASLLDLNKASVTDLDGLPGIGPSKAQAIVDFRESRKGFRSVEELLKVKGIGPKLYDKIRALVKVEFQVSSAVRTELGTESSHLP